MTGKHVARDRRGATAVEFALVIPVFLMFVFLILDGCRLMFTKQALNELAVASARCAAIKPTGCVTATDVQNWTVSRGATRSQLPLTISMVAINLSTTCNGQGGMAQAIITMPARRGGMTLLPQALLPANLIASSCFPVLS